MICRKACGPVNGFEGKRIAERVGVACVLLYPLFLSGSLALDEGFIVDRR